MEGLRRALNRHPLLYLSHASFPIIFVTTIFLSNKKVELRVIYFQVTTLPWKLSGQVFQFCESSMDKSSRFSVQDKNKAAIPSPSPNATTDLKNITISEMSAPHFTAISTQAWARMTLSFKTRGASSCRAEKRGLFTPFKTYAWNNIKTYMASHGSAIETWERQRLIWEENRSSQIFNGDASYVKVPTLDLIGGLHLPQGRTLVVADWDVSKYYKRLQSPKFLILFLGCLRIQATDMGAVSNMSFVIQCLTFIPLGAMFTARFTQNTSLVILKRSGFGSSFFNRESGNVINGMNWRVLVYIEEITEIETTAAVVNCTIGFATYIFEEYNLRDVN